MECGERNERNVKKWRKILWKKKLFEVCSRKAKKALRENVFPSRFLLFRLRLFFWVFQNCIFYLLLKNVKSQGTRIGTKAGDFKWRNIKNSFSRIRRKCHERERDEVSHDNASITIKRDCFMLPIETLGRNSFLSICCYFSFMQCQDNWRELSVDVKR